MPETPASLPPEAQELLDRWKAQYNKHREAYNLAIVIGVSLVLNRRMMRRELRSMEIMMEYYLSTPKPPTPAGTVALSVL